MSINTFLQDSYTIQNSNIDPKLTIGLLLATPNTSASVLGLRIYSMLGSTSSSGSALHVRMEICAGMVECRRLAFERRIERHHYEREEVYIGRVLRKVNELKQENQTYAEQLQKVENLTLFHLPPDMAAFIRDHDNMYRAAVRREQLANTAMSSATDWSIYQRVACRLLHMRNYYSLNVIMKTRDPVERTRMQRDPNFKEEIRELADLLTDDIIGILTHLDMLISEEQNERELENVGADHNVNDFGQLIPTHPKRLGEDVHDAQEKDQSLICCICLDIYDRKMHPAFLLNACGHVVGKPCFATWLNGSSRNSNLCPYCRTTLCTRRCRRPAMPTENPFEDQRSLKGRLNYAIAHLDGLNLMYIEIFGDEKTGKPRFDILDSITVELNRRLAEDGVRFRFVEDRSERGAWRIRPG
ncbi:hypothetical protein DDE82_004407 [Stemphylium lycopersici]|uniref:RING-type domain-containing protein n=1 Tax=Stemphylium lycopersici TaxID=183478 RepID=A0A364MT24_STELY|nr:hypothetical protein TW65_05721 [Stemphylium lycopersici]RAR01664.1 hypothetical protein DDE83_008840 [Stemphylium lycopersici]RAR04693.1 hypothetical protein DDE82_004407 [Stemphylium lycopersici]